MNPIEERRFKDMLKDAVVKVLEARSDLLRDAVQEGLEDMALLRAIQKGEQSRLVSRKQVFKRLERKA